MSAHEARTRRLREQVKEAYSATGGDLTGALGMLLREPATAKPYVRCTTCGEVNGRPHCIDCDGHCSFGGCRVADWEPEDFDFGEFANAAEASP